MDLGISYFTSVLYNLGTLYNEVGVQEMLGVYMEKARKLPTSLSLNLKTKGNAK